MPSKSSFSIGWIIRNFAEDVRKLFILILWRNCTEHSDSQKKRCYRSKTNETTNISIVQGWFQIISFKVKLALNYYEISFLCSKLRSKSVFMLEHNRSDHSPNLTVFLLFPVHLYSENCNTQWQKCSEIFGKSKRLWSNKMLRRTPDCYWQTLPPAGTVFMVLTLEISTTFI